MLGSAEYTGSMVISDFNHPKSEIVLKGRVFPGEFREFFDIRKISTADGFVDIDIKLITDFWPKETIIQNNIFDLRPEGSLVFNSFSIGFKNDKLLINKVNGNVSFSDIIRAENLSFIYKAVRK